MVGGEGCPRPDAAPVARHRAGRQDGHAGDGARVTAALALNQGFYNLFLAIDVVAGLVLLAAGATGPGVTALLIGAGSMAAAAVVLLITDRSKARPALVQGFVPAVAVVLLVVAVASGG